jgi:uracil-DNA glycosylase
VGFTEEEFRARCYFTAITKCYPGPAAGGAGKGDRAPTAAERAMCRPFLLRELALIQPKLILTVGRVSTAYFLGNGVDFTQTIGRRFEHDGRIVLPLPHPSGVSRWTNDPANRARLDKALSILRTLAHEL